MSKLSDIMSSLSLEEREATIKILNEINKTGSSEYLKDLYSEDYEEIPVSIDEFIENPRYAGNFTGNGSLIYPYWRNELRKIFEDQSKYQEIAFTGCLSGDTMIPLLNGKLVSMRDLSNMEKIDEYVYSFDVESNQYVPGHLVSAFSTGVKDVYKITFDNGSYIIATSNHKFMTRSKKWKSIDTGLSVGDSMMPCYRGEVKCGRGMYESIRHPQKDGTYIEEPTHRMVMRWKMGLYNGVVHHKDFNKSNNDPRNLLKSTWMNHRMYHAYKGGEIFKKFNERYRNGSVPEDVVQRMNEGKRKGSLSRWSNPNEHYKMSELTKNRMLNGFSKEMSDKRWSDPKQHMLVRESLSNINRDPDMINRYQVSKAIKVASLAISNYGSLTEETYNRTKKENNMRVGYPNYSSIIKRVSSDELYELACSYNHKIVSIEYIGKEEVYDLTVEKYHNFVTESGIVAHNSIGTGKSTNAVLGLAYILYRLMCLKDPQRYYRLAKGSVIVIAFFNNTLDLSNSVGYQTLQALVKDSEWFMERGIITGTKNKEYLPNKLIRFRVGSRASHALGQNVFAGMLDEVSFAPGANVQMEQSKIMETYNGVLERMGSRFMVDGKIAGKLFIVSSKKSEYDFLESYIRRKKEEPNVYVVDAKLWEVKPSGTYSGKTFNIAIGGKNVPSRIMDESEDISNLEKQGYSVLSDVPIEFKPRFEMDMNAALMNIAGISISYVSRFLSYDNIQRCYSNTAKNPFTSNVLTIGMSDKLKIQDFFIPEIVSPELAAMPIFIHIDTSLTGDRTGIGATAVAGYKYVNQYDIEEGNYVPTKELMYREMFDVAIQCPTGTEISFQKTREFIYYLKHTLRWNIRGISLDGYQSADTKQQLITMGFEDTTIVSLDKTENGYMSYKAAINEQRVVMIYIPERETELINLEQNNMTGKVDHPPTYGNGDIGRKDMSDASCGSLYNASLHEKDLNLHILESADLIIDTNDNNYENSKESILNNLVSSTSLEDNSNILVDDAGVNINDIISAVKKEIKDRKDQADQEKAKDTMSEKDLAIARFREAKRRQLENSNDVNKINKEIESSRDMDDGFLLF